MSEVGTGRHVWSVLCTRVLIDRETNQMSMDVAEEVTISGPLPPEKSVLPMSLSLCTYWIQENPERDAKCITISAERGGHAYAISRAIKYLTEQMGKAIQLDHKLHDDGTRPPESDFGYSSR